MFILTTSMYSFHNVGLVSLCSGGCVAQRCRNMSLFIKLIILVASVHHHILPYLLCKYHDNLLKLIENSLLVESET